MNKYFGEKNNVKLAGNVADINTTGLTGERVRMSNVIRLAIVVAFGSQAGTGLAITLQQHDAATAGNSKALEIQNFNLVKKGVETVFTKTELSTPSDAITVADIGAKSGIVEIEILSEDLDRDNNFDHVSVNIADPAASKIVAVSYVGHENRYMPAHAKEI